MYTDFFDFSAPPFHHLHLNFDAAANAGILGKPKKYYYYPEMNNYGGEFCVTHFGFSSGR